MGKSHAAFKRKNMPGSDHYFQSADFNSRIYSMYMQWLQALALNRFKWVNLPATCDERYLELSLFYNGVATIAHPEDAPAMMVSLQANVSQYPDIYDNPVAWDAFAANGWTFPVTRANGVTVFENRMRLPLLGALEVFARRLTAVDRTLDINMLQQRTPFLVTGPQEAAMDIANVLKQIAGGEPAIAGLSSLNTIDVKALNTGVPCIAADINLAKTHIWKDVYRFLGIDAISEKSERLISTEADVQTEPSQLMALDPLTARRAACKEYNEHFQPDAPLDVVWNHDNASDNYDFLNNLLMQNDEEEGADA